MTTLTLTNCNSDGVAFYPNSTVNWTQLGSAPYASWANWTTWIQSPTSFTLKILEEFNDITYRLPLITLNYDGDITVTLKIGNTLSGGAIVSPTTFSLVENTVVEVVAGRYYEWTLVVSADSNTPVQSLLPPQLQFDTNRIEQFLEDIDTSTLAGTIDARTVATNVSVPTLILVTAKQEGETYSSGLLRDRVYAVPDDYVFQENAITVNIVDKSVPSIRCFDLNGESIDAVVDIHIQGVPGILLTSNGVVKT